MHFFLLALFSVGITALDQLTKYLTVANIPLFGHIPFLPGVLRLTYCQNTGAAFSMLEGQQWLFALMFFLLTALLLWEFFKKQLPFSRFDRWCIAAIYGGGVGNVLDRIFRGFVVDMIKTEFIEFPVFNIADCFITCGCILLLISLLFFNKAFWKDEKK